MKGLIFIHVFTLIAICLHIPLHTPLISAPNPKTLPAPAPSNTPPPHNQTQYLYFMDELNKITNEAGYLLRTFELSYHKLHSSTETLLKKFNNGIEAIRKILSKYNLFITTQIKICPNPNAFNRTKINRYILFTQKIRDAIDAAIMKNSALSSLHSPTLKMTNLTNKYLLFLKETLDGKFCQQVSPIQKQKITANKKQIVHYKNNLDVTNWYYGSTTHAAYRAYLNKRAANANLTTCPSERPFVRDDERQCFNCKPGSIYNLGAQKCDSCKPGQMLNVGKGTCEPCYGEQFIINHQFVCKACAIEAQELFDPVTQKCYKCNVFSYFDANSRTCKPINCPADTPKFNKELEACQACPSNQKKNPLDPSKCIPIPTCTPQQPLYDNLTDKCKQCPLGQVYVSQKKTCELPANPAGTLIVDKKDIKINTANLDHKDNKNKAENGKHMIPHANQAHVTPQMPSIKPKSINTAKNINPLKTTATPTSTATKPTITPSSQKQSSTIAATATKPTTTSTQAKSIPTLTPTSSKASQKTTTTSISSHPTQNPTSSKPTTTPTSSILTLNPSNPIGTSQKTNVASSTSSNNNLPTPSKYNPVQHSPKQTPTINSATLKPTLTSTQQNSTPNYTPIFSKLIPNLTAAKQTLNPISSNPKIHTNPQKPTIPPTTSKQAPNPTPLKPTHHPTPTPTQVNIILKKLKSQANLKTINKNSFQTILQPQTQTINLPNPQPILRISPAPSQVLLSKLLPKKVPQQSVYQGLVHYIQI